jgi:hypothetical protein
MVREKARKRKEIIPVSHLRHTSDKACNVKASPNNRLSRRLTASAPASLPLPAAAETSR